MIFFSIIFLVFVSTGEIDICVPALPQMQEFFNISVFLAEFILGINLLFHCVGSLVAGIIGDRFGKKKSINFGMLIFILASILCAIANNYYILLIGRALQGIGVAMPAVLSSLLIFDIYQKDQHASMMTKLNGFSTLGISVAPLIGSLIILYFNWRFNFIFLTILGVTSMIFFNLFIKVEENLTPKKDLRLIKDYLEIINSKKTLLYIVICCISIASYYTFVGMSSIIYIEGLGVSIKQFGYYQGLFISTFGIFSISNGKLIKLFGNIAMLLMSFCLLFIFMIGLFCIICFNIKNPTIITGVLVTWSIGAVHPLNLFYIKCLNLIPNANSRINSLLTIGKWIFSIAGFQLSSYFYSGDFRSTGIIIFGMYSVVLYFWYHFYKKDRLFVI